MSSTDPRIEAINSWLGSVADKPLLNLRPASADASFRRYFRVDEAGSRRSFIIMDAPPGKEDTAPFIKVTRLLREAGVHAPAILAQDNEQGFLLLSDLGTRTYLDHLAGNEDRLYNDAIDALARMQTIATDSGLPPYDEAFLRQEMLLFDDWYAERHLGKSLDDSQLAVLGGVKQLLVENALAQPQVFVHRDYHSRNLMWTDDNNPGVIDYQDAMVGAITYDLVSLFKDCYIAWPRERVENWVEDFRARTSPGVDRETYMRWFDLMGVQRHLKVLGIFCRLYYRDGKAQYLDDLPLVRKYVIDTCERYAVLQPLLDILHAIE